MSEKVAAPHYSEFRSRFSGGQRLLGTFIKTPTTHATEIFGALKYDFIVIDEEHAPFDRAAIDVVLVAARGANIAGIVRVSSDDPAKILSCLDCGAAGVLVPHVATIEKAKSVAASARYRGGRRGYSGTARSGGYGATPMWDLVESQDKSASVIAMIEDPEALDQIDGIVGVDGIHGVFIGRSDLVEQEAEALPENTIPIVIQQQTRAFDCRVALAEMRQALLRGGLVVVREVEARPGDGGAHHVVPEHVADGSQSQGKSCHA